MKRSNISVSVVIFLCCAAAAFAAKKDDIPPWMENIDDSGRGTYLIPKGANRTVIGSQVLVEAPSEYVARRLYEMEGYLEGRLEKIEQDQKDLKEKLEELKKVIEELAKDPRTTAELDELSRTVEDLKVRIEMTVTAKDPEGFSEEANEPAGAAGEPEGLKNAVEDTEQDSGEEEI